MKENIENIPQESTKLIPGKIWNTRKKDYVNPAEVANKLSSQSSVPNIFKNKGSFQHFENVVEKENRISHKESKCKGSKSRRNASLEIILENGRIQTHRNYQTKLDASPRPGV